MSYSYESALSTQHSALSTQHSVPAVVKQWPLPSKSNTTHDYSYLRRTYVHSYIVLVYKYEIPCSNLAFYECGDEA
jgi:hypothetical protein